MYISRYLTGLHVYLPLQESLSAMKKKYRIRSPRELPPSSKKKKTLRNNSKAEETLEYPKLRPEFPR